MHPIIDINTLNAFSGSNHQMLIKYSKGRAKETDPLTEVRGRKTYDISSYILKELLEEDPAELLLLPLAEPYRNEEDSDE